MDRGNSVEIASEEPPVPTDGISCDLLKVNSVLRQSLTENDDVQLKGYLAAYKELYNFFLLLGGAFGFVASDVKNKIEILNNLLAKSDEFSTVSKMMSHEMSNKLLNDKHYVSGSRTLLRLHRGLDFLRKFLAELHKLKDDDKTGGVCREVYDVTLGNFHPWTVRKGAQLAMKLMPYKRDIVKKITKDDASVAASFIEVMPELFEVLATVYQRVDDLYTKNNLHDLS